MVPHAPLAPRRRRKRITLCHLFVTRIWPKDRTRSWVTWSSRGGKRIWTTSPRCKCTAPLALLPCLAIVAKWNMLPVTMLIDAGAQGLLCLVPTVEPTSGMCATTTIPALGGGWGGGRCPGAATTNSFGGGAHFWFFCRLLGTHVRHFRLLGALRFRLLPLSPATGTVAEPVNLTPARVPLRLLLRTQIPQTNGGHLRVCTWNMEVWFVYVVCSYRHTDTDRQTDR